MLQPHDYNRLPLYSRHERIIFEEAVERSKRYHNSIPYSLSMLYSDLRNSNDKTSASICYELLDRCQELEYDQNHNTQIEEEWEAGGTTNEQVVLTNSNNNNLHYERNEQQELCLHYSPPDHDA